MSAIGYYINCNIYIVSALSQFSSIVTGVQQMNIIFTNEQTSCDSLLRDHMGFSVSDWKIQEAKGWSGKTKQKA